MPGDPVKKNSRRGHKSALTREVNKAKKSMALGRREEAEASLQSLEKRFIDFEKAHDDYHNDLTAEAEVIESEDYFEVVEKDFVDALLQIREWLDSRNILNEEKKPAVEEKKPAVDELSRAELLSLMHLPKLELQTFDGDPLQYHSFIAMFDEHVEKVASDPKIKLTRLLQCTTGLARNAIQSCSLVGGEMGYTEARATLRKRFGNDHLIASRIISNLKVGNHIKSPEDLQHLADELTTSHATLSSLKKLNEVDTQSSIIEIAGRLQPYIRTRWKRKAMETKKEKDKYPDFTEFVQFVVTEAEEASDPVYGSFLSKPSPTSVKMAGDFKKQKPTSSFSSSFVSSTEPQRPCPRCVVCGEAHRLFKCDAFKLMKPPERLNVVRTNKLCENCLLGNHATVDCRKPSVCSVPNCGEKHTKFIHIDRNPRLYNFCDRRATLANANQASVINAHANSSQDVVLPVVEVTVNDNRSTCALLDTGSTNSFCTQRLVQSLGIEGHAVKFSLNTLNACHDVKQSKMVDLKLVSADSKCCLEMSNVYVVDKIPVSVACDAVHDYGHLQDLPVHKIPPHVDVLIGQDHSEALFPLETRRGGKGEPFAVRTLLGWSVNGPVSHRSVGRSVIANFITTDDLAIEDDIKALWEVERDNLKDMSVTWSSEDKGVIELWDGSAKLIEGHYELPIPWKPNVQFTSNLSQAMCRLIATVKSVEKRDLRSRYDVEMAKILDKGYAEVITDHQLHPYGKVWYLPHHAVLNPRKPDKLRVVFDCAAKYKGNSLNDRCYQGPDLNNRLTDVLLRFREHQYAVMSDIESMYHQVKIPIYDRDALRFLWYDESGKIIHCRMTSHLFGGVWCASSATYALRRLLHDHHDVDDAVANVVNNSFYVDDCLISVPDKGEAVRIVEDTVSLLREGGFRLTKFVANDAEVLSHIPADERAVESKDLSTGIHSKVLGIKWNITNDEFYFDVNVSDVAKVTKRSMLSTVSSIFDPLGFVNPVVVSGRLLFQEAVRLKLDWDDAVPPDLLGKWKQWLEAVCHLSDFSVARCIKPTDFDDSAIQLHHFCDASLVAYGFCTYVRCINKTGEILVQLLMSKCRIAPLKSLTIPRLELQAAVLAARADKFLSQALTIPVIESHFWTDSEIVIRYIQNNSLRFNIFVGNRVTEIRQVTRPTQWNHIASKDNPADLLTRGTDSKSMDMDKWLHGPQFLCNYASEWPRSKFDLEVPDSDSEVKRVGSKVQITTCHVAEITEHPIDVLASHYSSWFRLKKALAWWLRLKDCLKTKTKVSAEVSDLSPLTPNHLLLIRQGPKPPAGVFSETDMYRRRWKYVQFLSDQFWKRWLREYLPELQRRHKWVDKCRNLKVNDLVLLCDENTPRGLWPLGVVVEVTHGRDGLVRSVKVRTRSTTLVRPVTKVVLLEGES